MRTVKCNTCGAYFQSDGTSGDILCINGPDCVGLAYDAKVLKDTSKWGVLNPELNLKDGEEPT